MSAPLGDGRVVVIGVGRPDLRDDGFGAAVVSLIGDRRPREVELVESDGAFDALIDLWEGASLAVVAATIRTRPSRPGRIHRLSAQHPAANRASAATTGAKLGEAVYLARMLDRMPQRLLLFAVEAGEVVPGRGLTPEVADAAVEVAAEIADLLAVGVA